MRRELQWEATVARLQQQLAQLKGEGDHKAAEDAAEGQAKQLNSIRSHTHKSHLPLKCHRSGQPAHLFSIELQLLATVRAVLKQLLAIIIRRHRQQIPGGH